MGVSLRTGVSEGPFSYSDLRGIPNVTLQSPTFRIIGDSIASQNDSNAKAASGGTTMAITKYPYWWNMVCWLTGNAIENQSTQSVVDNLRYGSNSGIGGDDMAEVAARLPAIISSMPESHLIFVVGTNDLNGGETLASLNTRFETLTNMAIGAGKVPIWTTVLPRNAVDGGGADWGSTGTTAAQKRQLLAAHNDYRKTYCRNHGLICVAWESVFANVTGDAVTGHTVDGLHPSGVGSYYLAQRMINDLGSLIPKSATSFNSYDVYDATYNPYGNILNGDLSGTGGNISSGSGTGTVTGTVPDNFQLAKSTSTTTDCVAAIVSRTDGAPGNVLELAFTSYGTGNVSENWRLNYWTGASTSLASWGSSGDLLEMDAEIEYVGGHGGVGKSCGCRVGNNSATTKTGTTVSFDNVTKQILDSANGFGSFLANRLAVVSGATNGANNSVFKIISATAGVLQLDLSSTLVTESAGANVSVSIPAMSTTSLGASTTTIPNEDTPVIYNKTPVMMMPFTGNISPRLDIYVNGTVAGTYKIRIARPRLRKLPFTPTLLSFLADDN